MRSLVVLLFFWSLAGRVTAQGISVPASEAGTTAGIAAYISKYSHSDAGKIHAIYSWVTGNIRYDADSIHRVILDEDNDQRISYALKRKRGVCENFAAIFTDICLKSGIPSYMIEGYTRQSGVIDKTPHAWCAAFVGGAWALYDPTWDAGSIRDGNFTSPAAESYFQQPPATFIRNHLPFDPLFQFLDHPVTYREFVRGDLSSGGRTSVFDYEDSLKAYQDASPLTRYTASVERMKSCGWPVALISTKLKRVALEIEVIRQAEDMDLYNAAVADYNSGVAVLNDFLNYRNRKFLPAKSDEEVRRMFVLIAQKITSAGRKLHAVSESAATLSLETGGIQAKLDDLGVKLKEEQAYYKNFLASDHQ